MAVSHTDWELPNSRIWLAEIDIDRGLDFPILTGYNLQWKRCKLNYKNIDCFLLKILKWRANKPDEKKR